MKARTRAARRRMKPGPKPKEGVIRTPTGQISRSSENQDIMTKLELEAATWKRRQENPSLKPEEARNQEHGSVIAMWLQNHRGFARKWPDRPNPHEFTQMHYDAAQRFHELHEAYRAVISAKRVFSASDLNRTPGFDGRDPFDRDASRKHRAIEEQYKDARRAVLESGPLGMMAIEAIVVENKPAERLRADLRVALNRLALLWKMAEAA